MTEHYFSDTPTGPERRRDVTIDLFGRTVTVQTANGVFAGDGSTGARPSCCGRSRPRPDRRGSSTSAVAGGRSRSAWL